MSKIKDLIIKNLEPCVFRTRHYLRLKTGLSHAALDSHLPGLLDEGVIQRELFKSSPTTGRAEHAYRLLQPFES